MSLRLRDVTNDDLPLIEQWLHADHVHNAAFTDAVWRKENPSPEVKAGFDLDHTEVFCRRCNLRNFITHTDVFLWH